MSVSNALGFLSLGDDQPVIEEQIEKVSKDGNQSYDTPEAVSTRDGTIPKDRPLIMSPHPKVNPRIENCLSSLWALILTFCKIRMSRLDRPAGMSLWNNKPPLSQREYRHERCDPLSVSSLPRLYPYRPHRLDPEAHNREYFCGRASRRLVP